MELEELKSIWKEETTKEALAHQLSMDELRGVITRKSQSTIATLKRSLRVKVAIAGISGLTCLALVVFGNNESLSEAFSLDQFMSPTQVAMIYAVLGISLVTIAVFNFFNHIRITDFERSSLPIKETIDHVIRIIKSAINLGTYSDLIVSPVVFAFVGYLYFYQQESFQFDIRVLYVSMIYVGGLIFSYFTNRYAMQKRFGNDLNQLKKYQEELHFES
jgi:hypothetical protein